MNQANYGDHMAECLGNSISMVNFSTFTLRLANPEVDYQERLALEMYIKDEEEEMKEEKEADMLPLENPNTKLSFENENVLQPGALNDLKVQIEFGGNIMEVDVETKADSAPSSERRAKGDILVINKQIFVTIQEA